MVTALLVGLVVGFVLAMPPGPIAMACVAPQEGRCDETPQKAFYRSIIALFVFGTGTLVPKCPVTPTFQPSKEGNNASAQRSGKFLQCPFETIDVSPMRVRLCRYKR